MGLYRPVLTNLPENGCCVEQSSIVGSPYMVMPSFLQDKLELQPEQKRQMVNLRQHFLQSLTECHDSREAICLGLQQVTIPYPLCISHCTRQQRIVVCIVVPCKSEVSAFSFPDDMLASNLQWLSTLCRAMLCSSVGDTESSDSI